MKNAAKIITIIAYIVLISTTSHAERVTFPGFSIDIPDKWKVIDSDVFNFAIDKMVKLSNNTLNRDDLADYGIHSGNNEKPFDFPYILITVSEPGKVSISEFERQYNKIFIKKEMENAKKLPSLIKDGGITYKSFDKENKTIYSESVGNLTTGEQACSSNIVKLTEKGSISIACYANCRNYDDYKALFLNILNSIELSPELVHKQKSADEQNQDTLIVLGIALIVMLSLFFIIKFFVK